MPLLARGVRGSDDGAVGTMAEQAVHPGELFAGLSIALDLGTGHPVEHALRTCLLAIELAERAGCDDSERADAYHLALLHSIGCTADAPEAAARYGDDVRLRWEGAAVDSASPREVVGFIWRASGRQPRRFVAGLPTAKAAGRAGFTAHCEVGERLVAMLGLGDGLRDALWGAFERFDGKGFPRGAAGEEIPRAARILHVARDCELMGPDVLRQRSGRAYDPRIVALAGDDLMSALPDGSAWQAVVDARPVAPPLRGERLDEGCRAIAYFADLKSTHTLEHSTGVAELAEAAGWRLGLDGTDVLRRAGLMHDLGRVAVSTGIWDKPGPLADGEWERVRLHPYWTERALARADALAPVAHVAALHHERLDGSGYPGRAGAGALDTAARVLAAADVYHAMTETRAHRPARSPSDAADALVDEARAGRLDGEVVDAVLAAAGQASGRRAREWPAGLTDREVDVLRLVARGMSNREAAAQLGVSPKTVGHHVQHAYSKLGVSTRAAAALCAMQHGLLRTD
jgi:HD-GYP domain-containing protein (c-di-GMP phosphodiesterase class II)